jgi:hypothetical protein
MSDDNQGINAASTPANSRAAGRRTTAIMLASGTIGFATSLGVGLYSDDILMAVPQLAVALKCKPGASSMQTVLMLMASGAVLAVMCMALAAMTWMVPKDGGSTFFRSLFVPFSTKGPDLVSARISLIQVMLHCVLITCLAPLANFELPAQVSLVLACIVAASLLTSAILSLWMWRRLDELMRTIWLECCGYASSLFLALGISWSVLAGLGAGGQPTIFEVVAIFYGISALSIGMVYMTRIYVLTVEE